MRIKEIHPQANWILSIVAEDGQIGEFDMKPYLKYDIFQPLKNSAEFAKVTNGGYFVDWDCGADLSADTIWARWRVLEGTSVATVA